MEIVINGNNNKYMVIRQILDIYLIIKYQI